MDFYGFFSILTRKTSFERWASAALKQSVNLKPNDKMVKGLTI